MNAVVPTEAHKKLVREVLFNEAQCRGLQPSAQLIAESEARSVELAAINLEEKETENTNLRAEMERLKDENRIAFQIKHDLAVAIKTGNPSLTELHYSQYAVADLRERAMRAETELAKERARLDWLQSDTVRVGDVLTHFMQCEDVNLRSAIDAAMKETT